MEGLKFSRLETLKIINSSNLGEVLRRHELNKHLESSGLKVERKNKIDLVRYAAWLLNRVHQIREHRKQKELGLSPYDKHRENMAKRHREESLSARNIGEIPEIKNKERREKALSDFRFFCMTYWPEVFYLPFNKDHEKVIDKMIVIATDGGQIAIAMPRGYGKTALCERIALWSMFRGDRQFIIIFGATNEMAEDILDEIKDTLESNNILYDDFPEVCYPIRQLGGVSHRAAGQLYKGKLTKIKWDTNFISLPIIEGSKASGAMMKISGMTGAQRGSRKKTKRPDLLIFDDPQTDATALNYEVCARRAQIIESAVKGMAAPGKKIAAFMPCTVIQKGDLSEMFLNRKDKPEWVGERTKTIYDFPLNMDLWNKYAQIRQESYERHGDISEATEFYRENQEKMDEGALIAWPEKYYPGEISGIQSAMELKLSNEEVFQSEFQNDPIDLAQDAEKISVTDIIKKVNRITRLTLPKTAVKITAFVDVQDKILYWAVVAWDDRFTGYVIDYGTTPDQRVRYFSLATADQTLAMMTKATGKEGRWMAGFENVTEKLLGRQYFREDGQTMQVTRMLIDAADGHAKPTIETFCYRSQYKSVVMPYAGRGVTAAMRPFSEYVKRPGDRVGMNWRIAGKAGEKQVPMLTGDTNYWKSFIRARLATPDNDAGSLTFFGEDTQRHRLIAEHLTSEYSVKTEGRERIVYQWQRLPNRDNHWLDCIVGCAIAASEQGITLPGTEGAPKKKRHRREMTEERRNQLREKQQARL